MSLIKYNGVTLPFALITSFRQEAVGDDQGNTDWCYTKFDVQIQTLINAEYIELLDPLLAGLKANTSPAELMVHVRTKLLQRRRPLSMTFNGFELIPQPQDGLSGTVDAKNGPIPVFCEISKLTNTTFLCNYRIVAHYWEKNTDPPIKNEQGNNVLFNRWSETIAIDYTNYSTRTRTGKFVIRSDNPQGKIADEIRTQLAVVGVPAGFLRESASYTVSPDGLGINYTIVDREVFKKPPAPAFKASGEYREEALKNGAMRYASVRVRLEGSKDTSQTNLINVAVAIATTKLGIRGAELNRGDKEAAQGAVARAAFRLGGAVGASEAPRVKTEKRGRFGIIESASVSHSLYTNDVEVNMRAMYTPGKYTLSKKRLNVIAAFAGMNTDVPYSPPNSTYAPNYYARGTASFLLQAAGYYDPSLTGAKRPFADTTPHAASDNVYVADGQGAIGGLAVGKAGKRKEV